MFALYEFLGRRSFIDPICCNSCMVLSMFFRLVFVNSLFSLRDINLTLGLLPPRRHVVWRDSVGVESSRSGLKSECADIFHQSFLWLLRHTDEPQKGRNSCLWLQSRFVLSSFGVVLMSCRVNFTWYDQHCRILLAEFNMSTRKDYLLVKRVLWFWKSHYYKFSRTPLIRTQRWQQKVPISVMSLKSKLNFLLDQNSVKENITGYYNHQTRQL